MWLMFVAQIWFCYIRKRRVVCIRLAEVSKLSGGETEAILRVDGLVEKTEVGLVVFSVTIG